VANLKHFGNDSNKLKWWLRYEACMGEIEYSRKISDGKLKRKEQTLKTDVQKGDALILKGISKTQSVMGRTALMWRRMKSSDGLL
jgi:hypothetical protein